MTKEFDKEHYLYGRCHLYALICSKMTGNDIGLLWDSEYWHEDAEHSVTVLVHAYVVSPDGTMFDADGLLTNERLQEEYEWNEALIETVSVEHLQRLIDSNVLEDLEPGEETLLHEAIATQFVL